MSDISPKPERPDPGYSQADWDEVSDNPDLTDAELADLRPAWEVPEVFDHLPKRGRGRPKLPDAKVNLTLRVDPALLEADKATGPGWQVRMQDALAAGLASILPRSSGRADAKALAGAALSQSQGREDMPQTSTAIRRRRSSPKSA